MFRPARHLEGDHAVFDSIPSQQADDLPGEAHTRIDPVVAVHVQGAEAEPRCSTKDAVGAVFSNSKQAPIGTSKHSGGGLVDPASSLDSSGLSSSRQSFSECERPTHRDDPFSNILWMRTGGCQARRSTYRRGELRCRTGRRNAQSNPRDEGSISKRTHQIAGPIDLLALIAKLNE